jgi:hypothetical protein
MNVPVAGNRFRVSTGPALSPTVEIHVPCEHGVAFNRVEQRRVSRQRLVKAGAARKKRMRRDNQARCLRLQHGKIGKGPDVFGTVREIDQQDMLSLDSAFGPRNEDHTALGRVRVPRPEIELEIMKCYGYRVVSECRGAVDEIGRGVAESSRTDRHSYACAVRL